MSDRALSMVSTAALLPTAVALFGARSLLALVYLASFFVTLAYHASRETQWRRLDHVLAYSVIASNTWMAWRSASLVCPAIGISFVALALVAYRDARLHPERYDSSHALWHVLSGVAGYAFALGYSS